MIALSGNGVHKIHWIWFTYFFCLNISFSALMTIYPAIIICQWIWTCSRIHPKEQSLVPNNFNSFKLLNQLILNSFSIEIGNEVIAYNNSSLFDMVEDADAHLITGGGENQESTSVDKDTTDLFDLLNDPLSMVSSAVSPAKKKKRNWRGFVNVRDNTERLLRFQNI